VKTAPHPTRVARLDEVQAARKPILRWRKATEASPEVPPMPPEPAIVPTA